mmetsp:Transcript_95939/g.173128  ORF Transcript_95939/g.173128 Transcript_95939/m.173128 type:complete len:838 (+) Transcript_95939:37-2550(+)
MQLWMAKLLLPLFLLCLGCTHSEVFADSTADPAAVVLLGRARITVLTDCLLRLELSKAAAERPVFDDRATFAVVNRRLAVPEFKVERSDVQTVVVTTKLLRLTYSAADQGLQDGFSADSLVIELLGSADSGLRTSWKPGDSNAQNLNGTFDQGPSFHGGWDCYSTPEACTQAYPQLIGRGLLSRSGWALVNDTNSTRFAAPEPEKLTWLDAASTRAVNRPLAEDLYFLGPGLDFARGLAAWAAVSGRPALPPLAALGVWFSHYTVFSAEEYLSTVVSGYEDRGLPLNMAVLDVPWHYDRYNSSISPICNNWGGFTPNATLFADMPGFLQQMRSKGLKVVLSNHMQVGISPCEEHYRDMAEALGESMEFMERRETIKCALDNRTWVEAFFKTMLDSRTLRDADYWWNDFPGCASEVTGWDGQALETQFWADYVFDQHQRLRERRSVLLSRYGGLGSQRQGIGFSGDVFQNFSTLAAEIEFTPTASNVLFGYWSHDIGGFHNGTGDPGDNSPTTAGAAELFLRWVQFGVFSPIFRTHGEPAADRYLWDFSTFAEMKALLLLRNALVPHIYTLAWIASRTAVSMLRPMYYSFPEVEEAYSFKGQYMFGSEVLVAPIASPIQVPGGGSEKSVWLPPAASSWLSWDGSESFVAGQVLSRHYALSDIPLFVRGGSMLPMRSIVSTRSVTADPLTWVAWIGDAKEGTGLLYEDDGDGFAYEHSGLEGEPANPVGWATTPVSFRRDGQQLSFQLGAAQGSFPGQPSSRSLALQLRGLPLRASGRAPLVSVNGEPLADLAFEVSDRVGKEGVWVEPSDVLVIQLGRRDIRQALTVQVALPEVPAYI